MLLPKFGLKSAVRHESGWASVDAIYRDLDRAFAKQLEKTSLGDKQNYVYCYEDGALETFKVAKKLGITCVYDLPIAYWEKGRSLMSEEAERLPQWAATLGGGISDSVEKLERKTKELELADVIVGPGSFVMDSLPSWASEKLRIVSPFGSPSAPSSAEIEEAETERKRRVKAGEPLRVLFVGSMGQRKGLGDLFSAVKKLNRKDLELVVMGSPQESMEFYRNEFSSFTYEAGRSHPEVLKLMRSCDVFCLPSIVEGRALVMQEAMSQGLPLIVTPHTGGEDLIIEGETGFLVPIRSADLIAEKISWFADNRGEVPQMSSYARHHAARYTWEAYGEAVVSGILEAR
ncbi:glycosyltransferase family 4 protein [Luteolibacter sp. AS25]|uniref:glycosyltransferase family 4 protein n=1 Tax=Luteolibacter sp. AS25 TaxID=3135776 RepID=UPI00398B8A6D